MRPGAVISGRFTVQCEVAGGGMGRIFRAHDHHTNAAVAIKVMGRPEASEAVRFEREATVLAELTHPGIVRYVAHGSLATGELFLAMEWLEGEDLGVRLRRKREAQLVDTVDVRTPDTRVIPERWASTTWLVETITLGKRVAGALAALHAHGLVHRDIKPENIFLPGGAVERAKILDFGLARLTSHGSATTQPGALVGTPLYMSPEQARGAKDVGPQADVWALGCVLFRCLTGVPPFQGDHMMAVLAKIVAGPAPRLRDVLPEAPARLDKLLARMLAKDPALRPPDGSAVVEELASLTDETSGTESVIPRSAPDIASITAGERRVQCIIVGDSLGDAEGGDAESTPKPGQSSLSEGLSAHGVQVEALLDGSLLVTITGARTAVDQAARAARAALSVQALLPGVRLVLASGPIESTGRSRILQLIDRAVLDLASTPADRIRVDPLTADLLEGRFELAHEVGVPYLVGEIAPGQRARPLLGRPSALVGRDRELAVLEGLFAECASEPVACAVLITAPTGTGKSRLSEEFLRRLSAQEGDALVLYSQGDSLSAGSPFVMIAPAIRRLSGILDGEPIEERRRKLSARIERYLPEGARLQVTPFLGELVGTPFPEETSEALRAARKDPALMGSAMRAAWEAWLEAECRNGPVVLVLEDLHWGDLPSVQFIDAALRNLHDMPFMVLALARPEVEKVFPQLWAGRALQHIRLGPLSRKASERFVRQVLGKGVSDEVVQLVVDRSEGNAFYLEEMIRAVVRGATDALPDTLLGVLQARLDALGQEAKRVLRAGSIFGEVFWRGGALALLGGERWSHAIDEWLNDLVSREVIVRQPSATLPGEVEFAFRHALVREAAYAMLTDSDRELGHLLAARWFEQTGQADALLLAEHYARGGDRQSALRWYRRAAELALEGNDLAATIERAEKAIACDAEGETLGALRYLVAVATCWQSRHAEAHAAAVEAVSLLPRGTALWFRAVAEALVSSARLGRGDSLDRWIEEARATAPAPGAEADQIICLCRGCLQLTVIGVQTDLQDALIAHIDTLAPDRSALEPHVAAQVYHANAIRMGYLGNVGGFVAELERAMECFEKAGDRRNLALERPNVGFGATLLGDFARAEEVGRKAVIDCERLGANHAVNFARVTFGYALGFNGKLDEAESTLRDAAERCRAQKNPRLEGWTRAFLASVAARRGRHDTAEQEARAASALLFTAPGIKPFAEGLLARALLAQGRGAEALVVVQGAHAAMQRLGGLFEGESVVWLGYAEALDATGQTPRAREVLSQGRARLLQRAGWLTEPGWKERFLDHPDNAALLSRAAAWLDAPGG